MANKNVVLITNKATELSGIVEPIDESNVQISWEDKTEEKFTNEEFEGLLDGDDYDLEEVELDEDMSPAQATIKTHSTADATASSEADGNPKTKPEWVTKIVGQLGNVDMETLAKIFDAQQALIGGEGSRAGLDGKSDVNQHSIDMKPSNAEGKPGSFSGELKQLGTQESVIVKLAKEEQDAIFSESTLTEETKLKLTTLFEATVKARVLEESIKLKEAYEKKLEENTLSITENLIEAIDTYINHTASEWLEENKVAIESSLRNELVNEFINNLHDLFLEHYIDIPEEKVNIVEQLVSENENLQNKLNTNINEMIEKDKSIKLLKKNNIVNSMSEGLTLSQKEKFKKLTETVDFEDETKFKAKINVIKESFIAEKNTTSNIINEGIETQIESTKPDGDPTILKMVESLKNT